MRAHRVMNGRAYVAAVGGALLATACATHRGPASAAVPATAEERDALSLVLHQVDAFNAHDASAFAATYAEEAEQRSIGASDSVDTRGRQAFERRAAANFQRLPALHAVVRDTTVSGAFVVLLERITGGPDGASWESLWTYEVRGGRIARVWHTPRVMLQQSSR